MSTNSNTYKDNCFVVDGVNSSDWGIIVSGDNVFDMPERDVDRISVPGRNGELIIDNGRWNNIDVTYNNCTIQENFASAFSDFRSEIGKRRGYVRLEDSFNTGEYRMANLSAGMHVSLLGTKYNSGVFDVTFNCKPQRFLKSGETPIQLIPPILSSDFTLETDYIAVNSDLTFTLSCASDETIAARVYTYDSELTLLRTVEYSGLVSGDSTTCTFEDTDIYFRLVVAQILARDEMSVRIETTTVYNNETIDIDASMAYVTVLTNPTGYAAAPLFSCYTTYNLPDILTRTSADSQQIDYALLETSVPYSATERFHLLSLDCDLQSLYGDDDTNYTPYISVTAVKYTNLDTVDFPRIGEETTNLYMQTTLSSEYYGPGLVLLYPRWWRL